MIRELREMFAWREVRELTAWLAILTFIATAGIVSSCRHHHSAPISSCRPCPGQPLCSVCTMVVP